MYYNINWENDKKPTLTAKNLNKMQEIIDELENEAVYQKQSGETPLVIRKNVEPNFTEVGEIFYLDGSPEQLLLAGDKTFLAFVQDPNGRLCYNNEGVEFRYKTVSREEAIYLLNSGTDDGGDDTPGEGGGSGGDNSDDKDPVVVEYTIFYETNGGSLIATQKVAAGSIITAPGGTTEKDGYDFVDWYLDPELTEKVVFPYEVMYHSTFYAKWEQVIRATITYETNSTYTLEPMTVPVGTMVDLSTPTKDGYSFIGWYSDAGFNNLITSPYTVVEDITLYAKWEELDSYIISFVVNGGLEIANLTVKQGQPADLPKATKAYYDFDCWCEDEALLIPITTPFIPTSDITLYAKYTPTSYNISFNTNGGNPLQSIQGNCEVPVELPTPTYSGFTFMGWYSDAALTKVVLSPITVNQNTVLYAYWIQEVIDGVGKDVRYIKWTLGEGDKRAYNVFCEVMAFDENYNNIALNKPVLRSWDVNNWVVGSPATNGVYTDLSGTFSDGCEVNPGIQEDFIIVDLQEIKKVLKIATWGDHIDTLTHNINKIEISTDLTSWEIIYDSTIDGTYKETTLGHMINMLPDREIEFDNTARFIRWTLSENNKNARNVFCELMAFTNTNGTLENVALNKKIWKNWSPGWVSGGYVTDGLYTNLGGTGGSSVYYTDDTTTSYIIIDLEEEKELFKIAHWGDFKNTVTNSVNKIELSKDLQNWCTAFDSTVDGTYAESSAGHILDLVPDTIVAKDNTARFVRWTIGNNSKGRRHVFAELFALDDVGTNVALSKPVMKSWDLFGTWTTGTYVVDGKYTNLGGTGGYSLTCELTIADPVYIIIDLQSEHTLSQIMHWGDFKNSLKNNINKVELSKDLINWCVVFDATVDGVYTEVTAGHTINL